MVASGHLDELDALVPGATRGLRHVDVLPTPRRLVSVCVNE